MSIDMQVSRIDGGRMPQQVVAPIQSALQEIEQTFFEVREQWPRPGWVDEYGTAFTRLREVFEYIEMEIVRDDVPFHIDREVRMLREHCLWLVRRIGREVFFRTELAMERALREQTTAPAHDVYLRLIEIQDLEDEFRRMDDAQLSKSLSDGVIDQYRDLGALLPE